MIRNMNDMTGKEIQCSRIHIILKYDMTGKEMPLDKSDKYIELIHKSIYLYPGSKLFKKKTSVCFQPLRREDVCTRKQDGQ